MDSLRENGYIVIPVISEESADKYYSKFKSWSNNLRTIPAHGVISHYEIGHQPFMWELRVEEEVMKPYKEIYGESGLVVSFDGMGYIPSTLNRKDRDWWHVDQEPKNPEFKCIQSFVSLTNNTERVFQCIKGSHKYFEEYFNKNQSKTSSKAWQKVNVEYFEDIGLEKIQVNVKKGEMVLWDSRLVHCNRYGNSGEERLVAYISYRPRSKMTEQQGKKRLAAFENRRTTSHWAYPIRLNSLQPQVYGDKTKLINYNDLPKIKYTEQLYKKIQKLL
jgi:hypothetical protein